MGDKRASVRCSVCGREFEPRFSFQTVRRGDRATHFCSPACSLPGAGGDPEEICSACGTTFRPTFAWQALDLGGEKVVVCSERCRDSLLQKRSDRLTRIAVINQKGGTGKTTTAVNLAGSLAMAGRRTLLIDLDAQSNVGISLGVRGQNGVADMLERGYPAAECIVPVRDNLDAITSDRRLSDIEIMLARSDDPVRQIALRLAGISGYAFVVMDCAPSIGLITRSALAYADVLLVPVSCDYLSMTGASQLLKEIDRVLAGQASFRLVAVLPTFFDARTRISWKVLDELRAAFGEKVLSPIRINTKLREAPAFRKTIFEYAGYSYGANDYRTSVRELLQLLGVEEVPGG